MTQYSCTILGVAGVRPVTALSIRCIARMEIRRKGLGGCLVPHFIFVVNLARKAGSSKLRLSQTQKRLLPAAHLCFCCRTVTDCSSDGLCHL